MESVSLMASRCVEEGRRGLAVGRGMKTGARRRQQVEPWSRNSTASRKTHRMSRCVRCYDDSVLVQPKTSNCLPIGRRIPLPLLPGLCRSLSVDPGPFRWRRNPGRHLHLYVSGRASITSANSSHLGICRSVKWIYHNSSDASHSHSSIFRDKHFRDYYTSVYIYAIKHKH